MPALPAKQAARRAGPTVKHHCDRVLGGHALFVLLLGSQGVCAIAMYTGAEVMNDGTALLYGRRGVAGCRASCRVLRLPGLARTSPPRLISQILRKYCALKIRHRHPHD